MMMRIASTALMTIILLGTMGCSQQPDPLDGPRLLTASYRGLTVELELPKYSFYRGEAIPLRVTAINDSGADMVIQAATGALAQVTLHRRVIDVWEQIKTYPDSAMIEVRGWSLKAGESRTFPLNIVVAPDWPTNEPLRLVGQINGRPDVRPGAVIDIFPTRDAYERAMGLKDE